MGSPKRSQMGPYTWEFRRSGYAEGGALSLHALPAWGLEMIQLKKEFLRPVGGRHGGISLTVGHVPVKKKNIKILKMRSTNMLMKLKKMNNCFWELKSNSELEIKSVMGV